MKASGRQTKHLPAEKATGRQKNSWQSEEQLTSRRTADKQKNSWQAEKSLQAEKSWQAEKQLSAENSWQAEKQLTSRKTADKQKKLYYYTKQQTIGLLQDIESQSRGGTAEKEAITIGTMNSQPTE